MSLKTFSMPTNLIFDRRSIDYLRKLTGNRAVIVTGGSSMKRTGYLDYAQELLTEAGITTKVVDGVEADPSTETVTDGAKSITEFKPDWIIALGGGSSIDAAKIMWTLYEHPQLTFSDISKGVNKIPPLRNKAKLIAIPSTSGTASEVTAISVITDQNKKIKRPVVSAEIIPDIAIIDPEIPVHMPPTVTADTGMDVMSHALEAYVSTASTDYTDSLAAKAVEFVFEYLPKAYQQGDDLEARTKMHNASTMAGMAFNNARLGLVHSLAHEIGAKFGVSHGRANAIFLPYVVKYNQKCTDKYDQLQKLIEPKSDLANELANLNKKLDIPTTLSKLNELDQQKFDELLEEMSTKAYKSPTTMPNPRTPQPEEITQLLQAAYQGKQVDF